MKRILAAACLVVLTCAAAWAGDPAKADAAKQMQMMKAEMMKCSVCKVMGAHLDELGAVGHEVVNLDKGAAFVNNVEPAKLESYRKVSAEMGAAGEKCMTMTDAEAKAQLCEFCQGIRGAVKAGARLSNGPTKSGDMMVLIADDPTVVKQIAGLAAKCEMMMGGGQAAR